MRVLISGATGYVGKRLLRVLFEQNHDIVCCVRDKRRLDVPDNIISNIEIHEVDFLDKRTLEKLPRNIDVAYYFVHSMSSSATRFHKMEAVSATNFVNYLNKTSIKQLVYLSGISNIPILSRHLRSRANVEKILRSGEYCTTVLCAGIIVGSGSASFEIIRDTVEKLPVIVAPKWVLTKTQPIAIRDVISFLSGVMVHDKCLNRSFDIGGPEVLTYKEMLRQYAEVRGLNRPILVLPVKTMSLSAYWFYFITSVPFTLVKSLVESMKSEVVCRNNELQTLLNIKPIPYKEAIQRAFIRIRQNMVVSSWKDSVSSARVNQQIHDNIEAPTYGCYANYNEIEISDVAQTIDNIWSIGGNKGWYYADWLWQLRGFMDKLVGGVGLSRGRKNPSKIHTGSALDFWRVLYSSRNEKRLLLYSEMKLPGEAWLEFKVINHKLRLTATFRPKGIGGRIYWNMMRPAHFFIFRGMIRNIAQTPYEQKIA